MNSYSTIDTDDSESYSLGYWYTDQEWNGYSGYEHE
jgi:hypothetical protein